MGESSSRSPRRLCVSQLLANHCYRVSRCSTRNPSDYSDITRVLFEEPTRDQALLRSSILPSFPLRGELAASLFAPWLTAGSHPSDASLCGRAPPPTESPPSGKAPPPTESPQSTQLTLQRRFKLKVLTATLLVPTALGHKPLMLLLAQSHQTRHGSTSLGALQSRTHQRAGLLLRSRRP